MTAVRVSGLARRFGDVAAVDGITFDVAEGEFLALVGPSGCGKTTTLRMLAGLESADDGQIRFGDQSVNDVRPRDRNVAMVFQDYAVFPHLTVYENIAYGLNARHFPRSEVRTRVPAAAATFRIDHLLGRKPRQLSGGERQRVALARAMVREAELYLYDEPLSNLDAQLRHQARDDIMELHRKQGKPSVYVTHDQTEAVTMGDRIAVMRGGRIEQIGSADELYHRPVSLFVAFFIGTPSMNVFDAAVVVEGNRLYVEGPDIHLELPPELYPAAGQYVRRPLKVGIRPEDIHVPNRAPVAAGYGTSMRGVVNVIEPTTTGCAVYLSTLTYEPVDFVASFGVRLPASYIGKEVPLVVDVRRIHLFDAVTERSLRHG